MVAVTQYKLGSDQGKTRGTQKLRLEIDASFDEYELRLKISQGRRLDRRRQVGRYDRRNSRNAATIWGCKRACSHNNVFITRVLNYAPRSVVIRL